MPSPSDAADEDLPDSTGADSADVPPATILAPSPLLTLAAFLLGLGLESFSPTQLLPWIWNWVVGGPLLLAGGLLFGGALKTMRDRDKHPSHSDTPPSLITEGPFRYSRNPIYAGHSLAHAGASFLVGSVWTLLLLLPVVLYLNGVIKREEARLEALFGDDYDRYRQEVRRWV